ncbi:phenoloxidase-activating factor 2-like [Drosophila gunungcola]|nr:phenoloxidase-activating factor 2-like [Drosophila gunungcola]
MYQIWTLFILLSGFIIFCAAENLVGDQENEEETEPLTEYPKCGQANPKAIHLNLNVTGNQAKPGEFPWTIAMIYKDSFIGAGSLIAPDVVLTSAHRLVNKTAEDMIVSAGEWEYGNPFEKYPFEELNVVKIVIHESFDYKNGVNNLALLFLEQEFSLTYRINTICLPAEKRSLNSTRCMVAGWGKNGFRDEHYATVLKKIELPIVPREICQNQLRKTRMGTDFALPKGLICAGGEEGKDACTGDGGGALFCPMAEDPNRFEQIGIVNWGVGCKQKDVPGTYTDVAEFKKWIDQQIDVNFDLPENN